MVLETQYIFITCNRRQQSKHLGLNGAQQISGISVTAGGRDRRHFTDKHGSAEDVITTTKGKVFYERSS